MMLSMTGSIPAECYAQPRDLDFLHGELREEDEGPPPH